LLSELTKVGNHPTVNFIYPPNQIALSSATRAMPLNDFDYEELTRTLTENFNILADEVQLLSDRKTILEHKLRYAHESVSSAFFFPTFQRISKHSI
jgi:hypothetical protein